MKSRAYIRRISLRYTTWRNRIVLGKEGFLFYPFFLNHDIVDKKEKIVIYERNYNIDSKDVLDLAHKYNSTLTAFLVSVLIYSFNASL